MAPPRNDVSSINMEEQPESQPSPSFMTQSLTTTMAEGADLMREQDADILEQGILYSCSTGETPTLTSTLGAPSGSFDLGLPQLDGDISLNESSRSLRDKPSEANTASESKSFHGGESDGERNQRLAVRRCLSGEDRASVERAQPNAQEGMGESSASDEVGLNQSQSAVTPSNPIELNSDHHSSTMIWSKSKERLISEAAQFAEAVGEPMENEVQEIIEESDDQTDTDDDDAKEVIVNDARSVLPSLSPRKPSGRRASSSSPVSDRTKARRSGPVAVGEMTPSDRTSDQTMDSKPRWPFKPSSAAGKKYSYLHKLPTDGVDSQDYQYKGICSNPPEITKRGISRGNYAQLHRKAWLEVSDKYHRYGKNLRTYYKHWETLGHPTNMFFDWLDSKGEAAGKALPNLPECPRSRLDSDTVLYITNEEVQKEYEIEILPDGGRALLVDIDGDPVRTGHEGWIFVLRDHKLYGAEKVTSITGYGSKQRFHHSSFFGGKAVAAAGIVITNETGHLSRFYPHSGHYRPGEAHMQRMLFHLHHEGVDLRTFDVDTQQILHVARKDGAPKGGPMDNHGPEKKKKIHSLHLKPAVYVACFLAHKARFMGEGVYAQIHKIRKAAVATVTEALDAVDEGGYWKKLRRELVE